MSESNFNYTSYLKINEITSQQDLMSIKKGKPAHDEMLFIIVHQTYELWFKQILWEMDSIIEIFNKNFVSDSEVQTANHRLKRIVEIQRLLISQIDVLETMTPLEFLEFRNLLFSASGFQSAQFRLIENKMGLTSKDRAIMGGCPYHQFLDSKESNVVKTAENSPSLFSCVEKWLERTPYLQAEQYVFWNEYKLAVEKMFDQEKAYIEKHIENPENKMSSLKKLDQERASFHMITDEKTYNEYRQESFWKLSHRALMAALFIQVYRSSPKLNPAFQLITYLIDIDEKWTMWRYRHAQMAGRMLGQKVGTGGSSGSEYLKSAAEKHKVFSDFFKLATFFIPESHLPKLPDQLL
jgi:tryptophan 2,3-dioxygenase